MKHEQVSALLSNYAEAEVPAHTVDLTGAVRQGYLRARGEQVLAQRRWTLATRIAAALLIAGGLLLAIPSSRAALDDAWEALLQRLGLELVGEQDMQDTAVGVAGEVLPVYPMGVTPTPVSEDALQQQAPFDLPEPGWLPDGLVYVSGSVYQRPDGTMQVTRWYELASLPGGPVLFLEVADGDLGPVLLSEQAAHSVEVNGLPAVYIHGGWTHDEPISPGETAYGLTWDYRADSAYLSWADAELTYRIQAHGLGLVLEDLIRVAESLD